LTDAISLLLVDDESLIVHMLADALTEAGYKVLTARTGDEAVTALSGENGLAGLITDIRLGAGPDGWDIARHARELKPGFPIVYMTGDSSHDWSARGVPNSVVVSKPFAPAQIVTAISGLLNDAATRLSDSGG
jgi:two-component system, cell cycle response regulator CpdR